MMVTVVMIAGLLQASAVRPVAATRSASPAPQAPAVRVWRTDSIAYISLRAPGHLMLLHVDAIGRIQVLFPSAPWDSTAVSADAPIAVALPPEGEGNPATFLAIRTRWRFDFEGLRDGTEWNYHNAFLFQPTAGDPLGALFDIADRVTDGRPYDYGVVTYSREGELVARGPVTQPDVCWSCYRRVEPTAAATAVASNSVDCSNASLTNSFCGVNSGSVSFTTPPAPQPQVVYQPAPTTYTYYPLYPGVFFSESRRVFDRPIPTMQARVPSAMSIAPRFVAPAAGFGRRR